MNIPSPIRRLGVGALVALCLALSAGAETYPAKPVRVVLPYSAGSGPDAVVRHVGEKLARDWGQQVVVDNKPGANGWLAIGETKRAGADGHTLMAVAATHMALQPNLYKRMPFDPTKDFEPVAPLYSTNFFIVVGANAPWKNVSELMATAKAKPDVVTYGSWGMGSEAHLGSAMLEAAGGLQMRHVPFKELPQLYTAVATGEVDWAFGTAATVGPLYRAGKVKLLAYAGAKRLSGYADVPTVAEAGGPAGFELRTWVALYAPKGTPPAVVERINASVGRALAEVDVRERLAGFGFEPWVAPGGALTRAVEVDAKRYAEVVKRVNVTLD